MSSVVGRDHGRNHGRVHHCRAIETHNGPKSRRRHCDHDDQHHRNAKLTTGGVAIEVADEAGVRSMVKVVSGRHTHCLELNQRETGEKILLSGFPT